MEHKIVQINIFLVIIAVNLAGSVNMLDGVLKFRDWMQKYCKNYNTLEEFYIRYQNFYKQLQRIEEHDRNKGNFNVNLNKFSADLPSEKQKRLGLNKCSSSGVQGRIDQPDFPPAPQNIDYRALGFVTKVHDQEYCGSCYAFAANCALEAQMFKKYGMLSSLSNQNIVDCARNESAGNSGCNGGYFEPTYYYIAENCGINNDTLYPYEGKEGKCRYNSKFPAGYNSGFQVLHGNEELLKKAVAEIGPIAVGIRGDLDTFYNYNDGIFDDQNCYGDVNHAVCIVGYGTDYTGINPIDYWIVKNSWSEYWGESGYIRLYRGSNLCNITDYMVYPIV